MRFVPLTGHEDRARLLAIAVQDMSVGYHATLERELDDVAAAGRTASVPSTRRHR